MPDDKRPTGESAGISIPWVGARYGEARLVVVGENFNQVGGLGAMRAGRERERWGRRRQDV